MNALKRVEKIIPKKALEHRNKETWTWFKPGLAPVSLQTTGPKTISLSVMSSSILVICTCTFDSIWRLHSWLNYWLNLSWGFGILKKFSFWWSRWCICYNSLLGSAPWFEAFRDCFFQLVKPSDHEFIRHFLACILSRKCFCYIFGID